MDVNGLFTRALGLQEPWRVVGLKFDEAARQLDITVGFPAGSTFPCPECGEASKVHDAREQSWRHLNFFEHLTFVRARVPRVDCQKHKVKTTGVPWARPDTGFTLLLEAMIVELARNGMTASALARIVGEHDTRVWRVLEHYVEEARARADFSTVTAVGVDETSRATGHEYITTFVDMTAARVLTVTEGKDSATVEAFKKDFEAHGGQPQKVEEVSLDLSAAFQKGLREQFPQASQTFDPFHVVKLVNEAVDKVRREEQKQTPELKKSRYSWLKDETKLTVKEKERFEELKNSTLKTARAWRIKEQLRQLYEQPKEEAQAFFQRWYLWATHSRLEPIIRVAKTFKAHEDGILRWFTSGLSNGLLEGFNSLIQAAKARARGFRSVRKLKVVIYLLLSKLEFQLPVALPSAVHKK